MAAVMILEDTPPGRPPPAADFLHRLVPALGKRVCRLGLSVSHGLDERGIREALDGEMNYVFWNPTARRLVRPLRDALARERERYVVATGPTFGWFAGSIRKRVEAALRLLGTDYLDVVQLYWLGVSSSLGEAHVEVLARLRENLAAVARGPLDEGEMDFMRRLGRAVHG